jgi:hypothetical protein
MSKKKAVVFLEGNQRQQEAFVHELNKLVSEANAQPELEASLQTEDIQESPDDPHFEKGSNRGP